MNCPKCGKPVGDHDALCGNCGAELFIDTALADKIFEKKESLEDSGSKKSKREKSEKLDKLKNKVTGKKLKLILIAAAVIVLIVVVVVIVVSLSKGKGEKLAQRTSDFIGADFDTAEKKLDGKFKKDSAYKGLTNVIDYSRVAESDKSVKVDGVTYPEWSVTVTLDEQERILTVKYTNFDLIKSDIKGYKKDHTVNLDKFQKGVSLKNVETELDMDYYSVTYTKDSVSYGYRYWYENDSGDVQPVVLSVNFDTDGKFVSYSSILLYHQYM